MILFTIAVSATLSLPFAQEQRGELAIGFSIYFLSNSLALWLSYRGVHRIALLGYTAQVYLSTGLAMILMNEQPAHMVLAMANFVLLHAVVLGRRWALTLTGVMVVLGFVVVVGDLLAPTFDNLPLRPGESWNVQLHDPGQSADHRIFDRVSDCNDHQFAGAFPHGFG